MIELTPINIIQILTLAAMMFCLGASIDFSYNTRKKIKMLYCLFLVILWICIMVR